MVEHVCNLVRVLSALYGLHLLSLSDFLGLLGSSQSVLDAECVVTAVLLPKLFKILALRNLEFEVAILYFDGGAAKII
jgi:hypothetical protein